MKKRIIILHALILCLILTLPSCNTASPKETNASSTETKVESLSLNEIETENETYSIQFDENCLRKLHFYLGDSEYSTIDGYEELVAAVGSAADCRLDGYFITVSFVSNLQGDDGYQEIMKEREQADTVEKVHAFRERLNEYSKEYHSRLVGENMEELSFLGYISATPVSYSPFVTLEMPIESITVEAMIRLAENGKIASVSVSGPEEAVDDMTAAIDE